MINTAGNVLEILLLPVSKVPSVCPSNRGACWVRKWSCRGLPQLLPRGIFNGEAWTSKAGRLKNVVNLQHQQNGETLHF